MILILGCPQDIIFFFKVTWLLFFFLFFFVLFFSSFFFFFSFLLPSSPPPSLPSFPPSFPLSFLFSFPSFFSFLPPSLPFSLWSFHLDLERGSPMWSLGTRVSSQTDLRPHRFAAHCPSDHCSCNSQGLFPERSPLPPQVSWRHYKVRGVGTHSTAPSVSLALDDWRLPWSRLLLSCHATSHDICHCLSHEWLTSVWSLLTRKLFGTTCLKTSSIVVLFISLSFKCHLRVHCMQPRLTWGAWLLPPASLDKYIGRKIGINDR